MTLAESIQQHKTAIASANSELAKIRDGIIAELRQVAEAHPTVKLYPAKRTVRSLRIAHTPNGSGTVNTQTVADKVRSIINNSPNKRMGASAIKAAFAASGDNRTLNFSTLAQSGVIKAIGKSAPTGGAGRPGYIYALA